MVTAEVTWHGAKWRDYPLPPARPQEALPSGEARRPLEEVYACVGASWEDARAIIERAGKSGTRTRPLLAALVRQGRVERCLMAVPTSARGRKPWWYRRTPQEATP